MLRITNLCWTGETEAQKWILLARIPGVRAETQTQACWMLSELATTQTGLLSGFLSPVLFLNVIEHGRWEPELRQFLPFAEPRSSVHGAAMGTKHDRGEFSLEPGIAVMKEHSLSYILQTEKQRAREGIPALLRPPAPAGRAAVIMMGTWV